ncbi:MAG: hypothetical protein ACPGVT_04090 [Maricaulaceae bacterium]
MRFAIAYKNAVIGHSKLEGGDPPMGVAFGDFIATENFKAFRKTAPVQNVDDEHRIWEGLDLIPPNQARVEDIVGVTVAEYGPRGAPFAIEVTCFGIAYPKYGELFPHHVAAYEAQFPPAK